MSENVIYTIDCTYDDEWHKKNLAKEKLLKDRSSMTNEHINSIFEWPWFSDEQEIWSKYTKHFLEIYAKKTNSDIKILNSENAKELNLPKCWSNYQRSNLLKFYALKEFSSSEYKKFLCLDLDILISLNAPSIFEKLDHGFYMQYDGFYRSLMNVPVKLKKHFNLSVNFISPFDFPKIKEEEKLNIFQNNILYNGGVIFCDKKTSIDLCKSIPDNKDWLNFLKNHKLEENPFFTDGDQINDQDFIQVFLRRSNIKAQPLGIEWNCGLDVPMDFFTGKRPDNYYFFHLFGGGVDENNVRKLLPFLQNLQSVKKLLNFADLFKSGDICSLDNICFEKTISELQQVFKNNALPKK